MVLRGPGGGGGGGGRAALWDVGGATGVCGPQLLLCWRRPPHRQPTTHIIGLRASGRYPSLYGWVTIYTIVMAVENGSKEDGSGGEED